MALPQDCIGVDIAKDWIDVFHLFSARRERIATPKQVLARFVGSAREALVVLEASGSYERPVTEALAKASEDHARAKLRQAREFARATERLAKTDRGNAEVLALMGRALELALTPPADPDRQRLTDLVAMHEVLVGMIQAKTNRAGSTRGAWLAQEVALYVRLLQEHPAAVEDQIATLEETRDQLEAKARRPHSVPGIGSAVAAVLIAHLPELGHLYTRQISALVGLAPNARESGRSRG